MCGIYLALSRQKHTQPSPQILQLLRNRGPDSIRELQITTKADVFVTCVSTVLSLRGQETVSQPVTDSTTALPSSIDSFLCWNGEAWSLAGAPIRGNDSEQVFRVLSHASHFITSPSPDAHERAVSEALATFSGPYAFAYFDHSRARLYFGRDLLGRRSLLYHQNEAGDLTLSSISEPNTPGWYEVEADGIYYVDLGVKTDQTGFMIKKTSHRYAVDDFVGDKKLALRELTLNKSVPNMDIAILSQASTSVTELERLLRQALFSRVSSIPRATRSDDLTDSVRSACIAVLFSGGLDCTVLARLAHDILEPADTIDLLNVAFENPRVHKQASTGQDENATSPYELCPDRITGRASFAELQRVCPGRHWRFVAINIPYPETLAHRSTIMALMHPHNTEMDLSIACALYFAARGSGLATSQYGGSAQYTTAARVLLSGLGADELFAGYTRHGTAFARKGYVGLLDELELDIGRLGKRNLGRDDRVISTWAREARFPFLDENLVNWALRLPAWHKCGFGEPSIETKDGSALLDSSKKVLRCLAWRLGMKQVANEKKRAIQFGARTAKMETGRSKGTHIIS